MTMDFGTWSGVEGDLVVVTHGINVSNYNAGVLLRALELPVEDSFSGGGEMEIADFRKRLDRAESEWGPGDEGEEPYTLKEEGRATWHHMGRHPGYLNERFEQLREMLAVGEQMGHRYVVWY